MAAYQLYDTGLTVTKEDKLLSLSICKYSSRISVLGRMSGRWVTTSYPCCFYADIGIKTVIPIFEKYRCIYQKPMNTMFFSSKVGITSIYATYKNELID